MRRQRIHSGRSLLLALAVVLLAAALPASAGAEQAIDEFKVTSSNSAAGGHPDLGMHFELDAPGAPESARTVIVNTPEGIFGNPNAITSCAAIDFALQQCPPASQAGVVTVRANYESVEDNVLGTAPIYNLEPGQDQTAVFAFIVPTLNIPVSIPVSIRTAGDYGLRFAVSELTQIAPLQSADLMFWGFPAKSENDDERFPKGSPGSPAGCPGSEDAGCIAAPVAAQIPVYPLINNPVKCTGEELEVSIEVVTYQDPDHPTERTDSYPETTDCFNMIFKPVLYANPTTREADSPSGLDLRMSAPQPLGEATTPSPIAASKVTLPDGFTINPDAADGQWYCTNEEAEFDSEAPARCPDNAKIGTFSIGTPALDGRLNGSIYIGQPEPGDQYRLFLVGDGFGIHTKHVGSLRPNPVTGGLTFFLPDLPQVPFDDFELHLFASDRGLMATPTRCGVYEVAANFLPWNDALADQTSRQQFSIESGPDGGRCPANVRSFNPKLTAGTSNPNAGDFSDFSLQLDRNDGDQFLGDLAFRMPPGLVASLKGIGYCPESQIALAATKPGKLEVADPSCPPSSQIGTTNIAAGPGSHPFNVVGSMYLAGPFKGAPLSLVAVTPALAGPYDYGTQVVRVALQIDPLTARVSALSDTVPSIIGGVPLRLRMIRVGINRPNFMINPTNCTPSTIRTEGIGDQGTAAGADSYFRTVNCFSLGFEPKMTMRQVGGRKATRRAANPGLRIDLRTRPGDANLKSVAVMLPSAFSIDQRHLGNLCSEKELLAKECAGRQAIGTASTRTPLLDGPLSGPVYAVSGSGGLPRLAFILDGQVKVVPRADTEANGGRLLTTVPVVPDAEIGHFSMEVFGGKQGYLVNSRSLCGKQRPKGKVTFTAQNGKRRVQTVRIGAACGKGKGGKGGKRRG